MQIYFDDTEVPKIINRSGSPVLAQGLLDSEYATRVNDEGLYLITNDPNSFLIYYNQHTMEGYIMLIDRDSINTARLRAELLLIQTLEVEREVLCDLDILVYTNYETNFDYSGRQLGFTGCPNSVLLP